jgi:thiamine pyrophosphokinase
MPAEEGRVSDEIVVVVAGGEAPDPDAAHAVPLSAPVVAADLGIDHALTLGLDVSVAIGDFDSVSQGALSTAEAAGARVERHSRAKDETDLELALEAAGTLGKRILVLAGVGDRLDHLLALFLLVSAPRYADLEIDARVGHAHASIVRDERTVTGRPGELVSLFAMHGPADGVRTEGLRYPLEGETLQPGSTRGVSNELLGEEARVTLERGVLLALRPSAFAAEEVR